MSYSFQVVKCPECGASLNVEEGRKQIFCSYCGTKIIVINENELVYRHIDEAEVTRAETERIIKLKQLEQEKSDKESTKRAKILKTKITLAIGIIGFLIMLVGKYTNLDDLIAFGFIPFSISILVCLFALSSYLNKKVKQEEK